MLNNTLKYLKLLPVQLILTLIACLIFGPFLNTPTVQGFYTISNFIKDALIFVLPLIIFTYLFGALVSFEQKAPILILWILGLVFCSNIIAVHLAYGVSKIALPFVPPLHSGALSASRVLSPLLSITFPKLLSPDIAMAIGILCGIGGGFIKSPLVGIAADKLQTVVTFILKKTFIPVLPFYVAGFVLKLQWEGSLGVLLSNYIQVFILSLSLIILYISFLYFVGNRFDIRKGTKSIKNMLPALLTGFSTMSSAATMPVTLKATELNLKNKKFAGLIIPGTVNIHLMGDSLAIPLIGLALLWFKTSALPDYSQYLVFAVMFALTKFSCAAVPGGGVIIILPVLQKYLGLDQELISLMTTLYILQDSIFTAANVWGNGAFALITERICKRYLETHKIPAVDKKELSQQEQQELKV